MDAVKYLKNRKEICLRYFDIVYLECNTLCPLYVDGMNCSYFEEHFPEEAVGLVEEWYKKENNPPCKTCLHNDYSMPQCKECPDKNYKYYSPKMMDY